MAINPSSDIILDVLQAADPARVAAAEKRLNSLQSTQLPTTQDFAAAVDQVESASSQLADARVRFSSASSPAHDPKHQAVELEAVLLNSFVSEILPKEADDVFGKGFAGQMWRSVLADQVSRQIAKSGVLGIAKRLFETHPLGGGRAVHGSSTGQLGGVPTAQMSTNNLSLALDAKIKDGSIVFPGGGES